MVNALLSTKNPSKAAQIKPFFVELPLQLLTLAEAGIEGEAVEETGPHATLENNARIKAQFAHQARPDMWALADDTGIFIQACDSEPGVDAAYWGGVELTTEQRAAYCLKRLEGAVNRSAIFRTVVVLIAPDGAEHIFTGEVTGTMLEAPRVSVQPKMPYSALFVPQGYTKSWAEMTVDEENAISHRGKAFRQVRGYLQEILT